MEFVWKSEFDFTGPVELSEDAFLNSDDKALETAKRKGIAYLKISDTYQNENVRGLPTPFDLTGDPRWNEGGDLMKLYDLELEKRTALSTVFTGVNPVFTPALNTVKEDEMVNIIEYSGDEPDGDRVISQILGEEKHDEINSEEESADNDNGRTASPVAEILTFDDSEPKAEPKKRKSQLEQLGIPKPERPELTEDEQRKADELASELSSLLRPQKSDDFSKGLDFGSAF